MTKIWPAHGWYSVAKRLACAVAVASTVYGQPAEIGATASAGVVFTVLHSFTGGADGAQPYSGVIFDSAGNLYGTTQSGGPANAGVVYRLDASGNETVLHAFTGTPDGRTPTSGVIRDQAGNMYGTTVSGGKGYGVVYKLDATGKEAVLYRFTGGADGANPYSGVIGDPAGNLYGTASAGGAAAHGVVYKLDTAGRETVLHSFMFSDGENPRADLIRDPAGNLYGATSGGGLSRGGVVFELNANGGETVLHNFTGRADGGSPNAVTRDAAGNLYGTTVNGGIVNGVGGHGLVYKLDTANQLTVLHVFGGTAGGEFPYAGVIRDSAGNLYGTTSGGGASNAGVVYRLDAASQEMYYSFSGGADGSSPEEGLLSSDSTGNLYGTTRNGGASNLGVVFKISPAAR